MGTKKIKGGSMMNYFKVLLIVAFMISATLAGGKAVLSTQGDQTLYGILPSCANSASDTIPAISLKSARYFSIAFKGNALDHKDTAIVDSGFTVRAYLSSSTATTALITPNSADSVIDPFGSGSFDDRTTARSKALSLDAHPYLVLVFNRTDTNAEVLDFEQASGSVDSTIFTVTIIKER